MCGGTEQSTDGTLETKSILPEKKVFFVGSDRDHYYWVGWWFQRFFILFLSENWGRWTHVDLRIFFRWVGSTTTKIKLPILEVSYNTHVGGKFHGISHSLGWYYNPKIGKNPSFFLGNVSKCFFHQFLLQVLFGSKSPRIVFIELYTFLQIFFPKQLFSSTPWTGPKQPFFSEVVLKNPVDYLPL